MPREPATNRFLLNDDDMVVFGLWRSAMSIIIIYMYIYTHEGEAAMAAAAPEHA
jgi:hypothetical protein